jgi:DNA-binding PucR family transcriptional regulator
VERNRDLLRAFTAISRSLNLAQPLPTTLDLIAEKVSQTMGHKYCAILLADEETGELLIEGHFGLSEEYIRALNTDLKQRTGGDSPMSRSVTAQAYRTRMPVYVPDITLDPRFRPWREMALKVGYKSIVALPLLFRDEVIGVLNCYDEPRRYSEDQVEALMVVAEQAASAIGIARLVADQRSTIEQLNTLNRNVVSQHAMLQRSAEAHEALTALLLEDRSLDDITGAVSDLLGAPTVLQDEMFRVLSRAGTDYGEGYDGLPPDEQGLTRITPLLSELKETGRARSLKLGSKDRTSRTLLVAPVDLDGDGLGLLSAPLERSEEENFSLRTLEQATTIYALYMIKQRVAQETEDRIRGDLLADLLAARFRDEAEVRERARYLGLEFSREPFRIFVVSHEPLAGYLKRRTWNVRKAGHLRARLLALTRRFVDGAGMAGADGDRVVALLPSSESDDPRRRAEIMLRSIHNELPDLRARVGISGPCSRPKDLMDRYGEACALLELAESLGAVDPTICYDDWKVYGLLIRGNRKEDLLDLAHKVLDPLLAQGQGGQGDLFNTLRAYLDNNLSPARTAQALYVHLNTIKYRLRRITELLGMSLDDLDSVLTVRVALMVRGLDPESFDAAVQGGKFSA